jgi:hypothetical protein
MRTIVFALAASAALAVSASAETRNLTGFTSVNAQDRIRVEVTTGDYSVQVIGEDAARVRTRIENGQLRIYNGRRPWFGSGPRLDATVRVSAPRLEGVSAARGAELNATVTGSCSDFSAAAAMGGTAHVAGLRCNSVDASAAMGGDLRVNGECRSLNVSAAMGGNVDADDLECERVDASAAMGGSVRAFASEYYDASASMGGSIDVAGGASTHETSSSMGGSISHTNR